MAATFWVFTSCWPIRPTLLHFRLVHKSLTIWTAVLTRLHSRDTLGACFLISGAHLVLIFLLCHFPSEYYAATHQLLCTHYEFHRCTVNFFRASYSHLTFTDTTNNIQGSRAVNERHWTQSYKPADTNLASDPKQEVNNGITVLFVNRFVNVSWRLGHLQDNNN